MKLFNKRSDAVIISHDSEGLGAVVVSGADSNITSQLYFIFHSGISYTRFLKASKAFTVNMCGVSSFTLTFLFNLLLSYESSTSLFTPVDFQFQRSS